MTEQRKQFSEAHYLTAGRFHSYAHQLATIVEAAPASVLEIGVGSGFIAESLAHADIAVTTLDVREDLDPDLVGSVTQIPADDGSYDVSSCCQVLEHLPFSDVPGALGELVRVSRDRVVLSVPDSTRDAHLEIRAWKLGRRGIDLPVPTRSARPLPQRHRDWMHHQWEIGFEGVGLREMKSAIAAVGVCERHWRVPEMPWHHFFLIKSR
jgi:ubiquinone/menaquinone biosynthesis C-methylase UbiE